MATEGILIADTSDAAKGISKKWEKHYLNTGCIMFTYAHFKVILSIEQHTNGRWRHASITVAPNELPTWGDIKMMKDEFFGKDAYAIQILPPSDEYVNVHIYCMHLWQYLDGKKWPMEL